ncbi:MAG: TetR/AcrR family transcriptional regulator [Alphaproteobacteria bacterium]|nr:TetR/AcrR family transcriptional regulator [Alphaproteobacteria bacterium]
MDTVQPRKKPKQARSKARYDLILSVARDLIGAQGNDAVSVRDIAGVADIPIASIYQYFPDKNAILWALVEERLSNFEHEVETRMSSAQSLDELATASEDLFWAFSDLFVQDSALAQIWRSIQANVTLRELDRTYTERLAEHYVVNARRLGSSLKASDLRDFAVLAGHLGTAAVQVVQDMTPRKRKRTFQMFVQMMMGYQR